MSKLIIPKVIAHRGAKAYAPENTLAAFHTAADLGIEWVEVDVVLTKDDVPIIFHDDEIDRCTNGHGLVTEMDFATLRELDAGSWFGDSFAGEKIPTLEETLNMVIDRGLGINIEIKGGGDRDVETAEIALDIATRIWPDDAPPPLISSFSHVCLEAALDVMPDWPRGLLIGDYLPNWKDIAEHLEAYTINVDVDKTTHAQFDEYIGYGRPVLSYTLNDPKRARQIFDWGVTGVFSDCPDVIRDEVEQFH